MKFVLILSTLTITSAFVHDHSIVKKDVLVSLEKKIEYINTQTYINQRLFELKINSKLK